MMYFSKLNRRDFFELIYWTMFFKYHINSMFSIMDNNGNNFIQYISDKNLASAFHYLIKIKIDI